MMFKHLTFSLSLGAIALALSGAAMAHVDVGLNIGVDRYWDGQRYWNRRDWYDARGHHDYRRG